MRKIIQLCVFNDTLIALSDDSKIWELEVVVNGDCDHHRLMTVTIKGWRQSLIPQLPQDSSPIAKAGAGWSKHQLSEDD